MQPFCIGKPKRLWDVVFFPVIIVEGEGGTEIYFCRKEGMPANDAMKNSPKLMDL
jgi:hypothetical protein